MKNCNKCKIEKPYTDFHKRTISYDGLDATCRECRKAYSKSPGELKDADGKFRIPAEEILTNMGFELYNDDNPVWKQFNRRIELKYGVILDGIKEGS